MENEQLTKIKRTEEGTYRAQLVEIGGGPPFAIEDEPIVAVTFHMPLSDARRLGGLMYDPLELKATKAELSEGPLFP
jgi:hypothetical protein